MTTENSSYSLDSIDCLRRNIKPETMAFVMQAADQALEEGDRGISVVSDTEAQEQYQLSVIEGTTVVFECGNSGEQRVPINEFKALLELDQA